MKRSLAPPRRDKPTGGDNKGLAKTLPAKTSQDKSLQSEKSINSAIEHDHQDRAVSQKFEEKYRNKNLNILPTQMLVALSGLTTLDISFNKLADSQIQLLTNSCTKLSTFCMQGNLTYLIPSSISKLKLLVNFNHDWVKLSPEDIYECRLDRVKEAVRKPQILSKVGKIEGIDFISYSKYILEVSFTPAFSQKIDKCECTTFAKDNMLKCYQEGVKQTKRSMQIDPMDSGMKKNLLGQQGPIVSFEKSVKMDIRQNLSETETASKTDLSQNSNVQFTDQEALYYSAGMPLHNLFATFDRNHYAPAEIDGLLLRGYNPNQYDSNGFSPYHACVIAGQKKGLEYLLQISSNNPGFFDLEMPSVKQGRNILHLSIALKNYTFAKMLFDFGFPIDKRDINGYRLIHLNEQSIQFQTLVRKNLRKRTQIARNLSVLSVPLIPHQNKRNYIKHPQRQKEQSRFRITYSRNDKLLEMYEAAAGIPIVKM